MATPARCVAWARAESPSYDGSDDRGHALTPCNGVRLDLVKKVGV